MERIRVLVPQRLDGGEESAHGARVRATTKATSFGLALQNESLCMASGRLVGDTQ